MKFLDKNSYLITNSLVFLKSQTLHGSLLQSNPEKMYTFANFIWSDPKNI